jgi:hypothetical protein
MKAPEASGTELTSERDGYNMNTNKEGGGRRPADPPANRDNTPPVAWKDFFCGPVVKER